MEPNASRDDYRESLALYRVFKKTVTFKMLVFNGYSKRHCESFLIFLHRTKLHDVGKGMLIFTT